MVNMMNNHIDGFAINTSLALPVLILNCQKKIALGAAEKHTAENSVEKNNSGYQLPRVLFESFV